MKTMRESLKNFSEDEQNFLIAFGRDDILKLAQAFDCEIEKAKYDVSAANTNHETFCKSKDGIFKDPFSGEGGAEECNQRMNLSLLQRSNKYLKDLWRKRNEFLIDPEGYRKCLGCGEIIPIERQEEVPISSYCGPCKNGQKNKP